MRPMSRLTGPQIAETTKVEPGSRSGLVAPMPRPAIGRSTTPTCGRPFPRKSPPRRDGLQQRSRPLAKKWGKSVRESRWMWTEYQRKWPSEERTPVKRPDDTPGSWRGEGNRSLKPEANGRVDAACDQIADRERQKISPAMRAVESQDPDRHLIGFEHRLKGRDRIKDKVSDIWRNLDSPEQSSFNRVPDAIRYTFEYREARYTQGVWADIGRLKAPRLSAGQPMECCGQRSVQGNQQPMDRSGERPAVRSTVPHSHQLRGKAAHTSCLRTATNSDRPISSSRWSWKPFRKGYRPTCQSRLVLLTFPTIHRGGEDARSKSLTTLSWMT